MYFLRTTENKGGNKKNISDANHFPSTVMVMIASLLRVMKYLTHDCWGGSEGRKEGKTGSEFKN